jgi:CBS domain containing-hemolysin-like protein
MEEIVGEIYDESDDIEQEIISTSEDSYEVDGGLNILDMFDMIDFHPRDFDSEYTTVGGWAAEMLDRIPVPGDSFSYENLTVTVLEAESNRVERLHVDITREDSDDID